jgi:hypothetical protein
MQHHYKFLLILACAVLFGNPVQAQWYKFKRSNKTQENIAPAPPVIQVPQAAPISKPAVKEAINEKPSGNSDEKSVAPSPPAPPATQPEYPIVQRPENTNPVVQQSENGQINWTDQYIEAKGFAIIDSDRFKNPAQAKLMAIRGATVVAQRNLLEIANGVKVVGETTVQDMMTINDEIVTRVEGVVRGAQMVGDPVEKQGYIEVILRMPLYAQGGLAQVLHQDASQLANNYKTATDYIAPALQAIGGARAGVNGAPTGIAFQFNGKTIDPSMFPLIVDEKGNLIFDLTKLYDPKTGLFPQILQTSRAIFDAAGYQKGMEVINVIDSFDGKIVVSQKEAKKINWGKIGKAAASIGSILLAVL